MAQFLWGGCHPAMQNVASLTAHAWVAGSVNHRQPINVPLSHRCFSPSLSASLPLSLNKINSKWINDLDIRIQMRKLLEGNGGKSS